MNIININYISPVSKYPFNPDNKYVLIVAYTHNNQLCINKILIDKLTNVNQRIRAYTIQKSVMVSKPASVVYIGLFETGKQLKLLFSNKIFLDRYEINNKSHFTLLACYEQDKHSSTGNNTNYADEQFYSINNIYNTNEYCLLFVIKNPFPQYGIVKPYTIDITKSDTYVYNRYYSTAVKEFIPDHISKKLNYMLSREKHYNHIRDYNSRYNKEGAYLEYKQIYQIDHIPDRERPITHVQFNNNDILSPIDSRVRGFNINPTLKLSAYNTTLSLQNLNIKLNSGSGYYCRICPQDDKMLCTPYGGDLTEICLYKLSAKHPYIMVFRFDNDYYQAPSVKERAYLSVIRGNHTNPGPGVGAGSRAYPELLEQQEDTHLTYYIIVVGTDKANFILYKNPIFSAYTTILPVNKPMRPNPIYIDKGSYVGRLVNSGGSVTIVCNRLIDFSDDIKYYSKIAQNDLSKPIDCIVKRGDTIGYLL